MLSERQKLILAAIVDDYIRSAEPVGSRSISKRSDVGYSPATIRNEMSDLEEMGYLDQPHTSAGRIPSHKGYRYYVDHLLKLGKMSDYTTESLRSHFADQIQETEEVAQQVAMILSNLTKYTSIVLGPEVFNMSLQHLQLVPLNENTAVAVIVTSTGHVENKLVQIPEGISTAKLERAIAILNGKLKGMSLLRLKSSLYDEIAAELRKEIAEYEQLIKLLDTIVQLEDTNRVFLGGTTNMLTQPEFKDVGKIKEFLDLLDETNTLLQIVSNVPEGIQVRIGTENRIEAINNCSLITASYSINGQALGTLGILGPTRMDYGKVITLLHVISKDLAHMFEDRYK